MTDSVLIALCVFGCVFTIAAAIATGVIVTNKRQYTWEQQKLNLIQDAMNKKYVVAVSLMLDSKDTEILARKVGDFLSSGVS